MDDLSQYMADLREVQRMNFDYAFMVHSQSYQDQKIVVDAKKKIAKYIKYREDRDREILTIVREVGLISAGQLFNIIYMNQNLTDPLRKKLAQTSFNAHLVKLEKEGKIRKE
jgi:hypothetical protein